MTGRRLRASDFESEGREFESLRARQHLSVQTKGFLQFRLRSICQFRVARRCEPIQRKSAGYKALPITPRNTGATYRFVFRSHLRSKQHNAAPAEYDRSAASV